MGDFNPRLVEDNLQTISLSSDDLSGACGKIDVTILYFLFVNCDFCKQFELFRNQFLFYFHSKQRYKGQATR